MRGKLISAEMFLSFPPLSPGDRIRKRKILQLFLFFPLSSSSSSPSPLKRLQNLKRDGG